MSKNNHPLNKLFKLVKKNGIKCLLPQNLTDDLFNRMLLEADALDNDKTDEFPSSTLLMAILHLESRTILTEKNIEIKIAPEKLMDYFSFYITALRLEDMRRKEIIDISKDTLPTLDNIFDKNRIMAIKGNP